MNSSAREPHAASALDGLEPVVLPGAGWFDLRGGEGVYRIFVATPCSPAPTEGFPVIYMLDANAGFATFVEVMRRGTVRPSATGMGEVVIVGIGYPEGVDARTRRSLDYTGGPQAGESGGPARRHGGRDAFLGFIENVLKPRIAQAIRIDPARQTLFGHSLAGWFVLDVMARNRAAFSTYVAVSPSIWWDEARLEEGLLHPQEASPRLALMVGEWEQALAPWQQARPEAAEMAERRGRRAMVDRTRAFAARAATVLGEEQVSFELLAGEDHASVLPPAMARALRLAVSGGR